MVQGLIIPSETCPLSRRGSPGYRDKVTWVHSKLLNPADCKGSGLKAVWFWGDTAGKTRDVLVREIHLDSISAPVCSRLHSRLEVVVVYHPASWSFLKAKNNELMILGCAYDLISDYLLVDCICLCRTLELPDYCSCNYFAILEGKKNWLSHNSNLPWLQNGWSLIWPLNLPKLEFLLV